MYKCIGKFKDYEKYQICRNLKCVKITEETWSCSTATISNYNGACKTRMHVSGIDKGLRNIILSHMQVVLQNLRL